MLNYYKVMFVCEHFRGVMAVELRQRWMRQTVINSKGVEILPFARSESTILFYLGSFSFSFFLHKILHINTPHELIHEPSSTWNQESLIISWWKKFFPIEKIYFDLSISIGGYKGGGQGCPVPPIYLFIFNFFL